MKAAHAVLAVVAIAVHVSENHFLMAFHALTTPAFITVHMSENSCPRSIPKASAIPHNVSQKVEKKLVMAVQIS